MCSAVSMVPLSLTWTLFLSEGQEGEAWQFQPEQCSEAFRKHWTGNWLRFDFVSSTNRPLLNTWDSGGEVTTLHRENMLLRNVDALDQCFQNFPRLPLSQYKNTYTYHYYNTKHLQVPLLQYKTFTSTTIKIQNIYNYQYYNTRHLQVATGITIQNIYKYQYYNTKHLEVPVLQYKTFTSISITIQNMCTYQYYNTKHLQVPVLQYKTCTRTTSTTQNMHTYHY
jgi:hypothetical protein